MNHCQGFIFPAFHVISVCMKCKRREIISEKVDEKNSLSRLRRQTIRIALLKDFF